MADRVPDERGLADVSSSRIAGQAFQAMSAATARPPTGIMKFVQTKSKKSKKFRPKSVKSLSSPKERALRDPRKKRSTKLEMVAVLLERRHSL